MKLKGPLVTLFAGLCLAAVLFGLNVHVNHRDAPSAGGKATPPPTTAAAAPSSAAAAPKPAAPSAVPEGKNTFAGETDGGAAGLAIATDNGKAVAYVCDGRAAEAWVTGTAAQGQISLVGKKGSLTGTYSNGVATGTVTVGSKQWHFTIKLAKPPSGLYRSAAGVRQRLNATWAVTPDGKQYGLAWDPNGTSRPAPAFDTSTFTVDLNGDKLPVEPGNPNDTSGQ